MSDRATIIERVEFVLARIAISAMRLIGPTQASRLGGAVAAFAGPILARPSRRARINLKIAHPEASEREIDALLRHAWRSLGAMACEFACLDRIVANADAHIEITGADQLDDARRAGRPIIFVSGHFANWEILPAAIARIAAPLAAVYRPLNNRLIDRVVMRARAAEGVTFIQKGKRGGREIIAALDEGGALLLLVDQRLTSGGVASTLFGKPALTAPAAARLALRYGGVLAPVFIERIGPARFRARFEAPIEPKGQTEDALLAALNARIERQALARPAEWLWHHRRFDKSLYA
jgi:KDO2-lipid IV(A) lauroyltransferase